MLEVQKLLEAKVSSGLSELQAFECLNTELGIKVKHYEDKGITLLDYDQIDSPKSHPIVIECRSLILYTDDFQLVSMKFPRFFNLGENPEYYKDFDWKKSIVFEKLDGSLVGVYCLQGNWYISTRGMAFAEGNNQLGDGTFQQDIIEAFGLSSYDEFNERFKSFYDEAFTFIFEYCSPRNKVVTPYDKPIMVLTGITNRDDDSNYCLGDLKCSCWKMKEVSGLNVRLPEIYDFNDIDNLVKKANELEGLKEGFVVWDEATNKRCKIKSSTYVLAHSLRGNDPVPTRKNLLKLVFTGEVDEFVSYFPEWKDDVDSVLLEVETFKVNLNETYDKVKHLESQKDFALAVKDTHGNAFLFSARKQNKTVNQVIAECPADKLINLFV